MKGPITRSSDIAHHPIAPGLFKTVGLRFIGRILLQILIFYIFNDTIDFTDALIEENRSW